MSISVTLAHTTNGSVPSLPVATRTPPDSAACRAELAVRVPTGDGAVPRLAPRGALVRNGGHWAFYGIEDRRARLRAIEVSTLTDRTAEVTAGVAPGDTVIMYPSDHVHDGVRVQARN
jgi:hypothetical protein